MKLTDKQIQKFWAKVNIKGIDDCWEWQGALQGMGYGDIKINGKTYNAHRISFMLANGYMPRLFILHNCDNRKCINPRHLREGTHLENMFEMRKRGRAGKKLTRRDVSEIRQAKGTHREIAKRFNVSHRTIGQVLRRQTWNA
jgi:hypothetical protein